MTTPERQEVDAAWFQIEHGWDIEPRAYFEKEAPRNGFKFALAQAIHHIWKRDTKVRELQAALSASECEVCRRQTHAKWHEAARGDINPVALIQMIESLDDGGTGVVRCVVDWVAIMTGMDVPKMRAMLAEQNAPSEVSRHA